MENGSAYKDKWVNASEIIRSLTVDPIECPGCPAPEFLQDIINILEEAPGIYF